MEGHNSDISIDCLVSKIGLDYAYLEALTNINDLLEDHFRKEIMEIEE